MMIFGYSTAPFMENGGKECDDSSTSKHENDPQEVIPELWTLFNKHVVSIE